MIQENEIRLGNLINPLVGTNEHIGKITLISQYCVGFDLIDDNYEEYLSISHESTLSEIKPIPITEEILLKFGFEWSIRHQALKFKCFDYVIDFYESHPKYTNQVGFLKKGHRNGDTLIFVEYVHQLQNLYFALTGQELTFKN